MGQCIDSLIQSDINDEKEEKHKTESDSSILPHLTWTEIATAIKHELYPGLAKEILKIVQKERIEWQAIYYTTNEEKMYETNKGIEFIIQQLKQIPRLDIDNDEAQYIRELLQRARIFKFNWFNNGLEYNFKYKSDFDGNGLLYFLGIEYGTKSKWSNPAESGIVQVQSSSLHWNSNSLTHFVGRRTKHCMTNNKRNQWMKVDLNDVKIRLTHYTLRHHKSETDYLRNWNLEGSNDGIHWTIIKKHTNDTLLTGGKGVTATWKIETNEYFNQFRIFMTGCNSGYYWKLACSGMELYGDAYIDSM